MLLKLVKCLLLFFKSQFNKLLANLAVQLCVHVVVDVMCFGCLCVSITTLCLLLVVRVLCRAIFAQVLCVLSCSVFGLSGSIVMLAQLLYLCLLCYMLLCVCHVIGVCLCAWVASAIDLLCLFMVVFLLCCVSVVVLYLVSFSSFCMCSLGLPFVSVFYIHVASCYVL